MAFAQVVVVDTKTGVVTSNSNSWTLTYPTNLAAGNLILAFVATDGEAAATWPSGWVQKVGFPLGAVGQHIAAKISDGTETGTFTLGLDASEQGAWRIFRITEWYGGSLGTTSGHDADGLDFASPGTGSPTNTPNPPSLDPATWTSEDTLWFASCAVDTSRTISVWPLPDLNTSDVSGGAGGATLGICSDELAQASLDPGTFTISASDDWKAATIAIRPAAGVAQSQAPRSMHQFRRRRVS
jgi:hypothetical protein